MSTVSALRLSHAYCSFSEFALANHSQPMVFATSAQPDLTSVLQRSMAAQSVFCVCAAGGAVAAAVHHVKTGAA